jgi:hypothetical protein
MVRDRAHACAHADWEDDGGEPSGEDAHASRTTRAAQAWRASAGIAIAIFLGILDLFIPGQLVGGTGVGWVLPAFTGPRGLDPAAGAAVEGDGRPDEFSTDWRLSTRSGGVRCNRREPSRLTAKSDLDRSWLFMAAVSTVAASLVLAPLLRCARATSGAEPSHALAEP